MKIFYRIICLFSHISNMRDKDNSERLTSLMERVVQKLNDKITKCETIKFNHEIVNVETENMESILKSERE